MKYLITYLDNKTLSTKSYTESVKEITVYEENTLGDMINLLQGNDYIILGVEIPNDIKEK